MFIDAHVHPELYEPICTDERLIELRRDSLHILKMSVKPMEHIFCQMAAAKLDKSVLFAKDYRSSDGEAVLANEAVAELCRLYPERFIGVASVDPSDPAWLEKAEYAFTELGLKGIKLHPGRQKFYPGEERMEPLYRLCEAYDKPIVLHSGLSFEPDCPTKYARPIEFEPVAMNHPKLRICLAHFGWPWVRETAMLLLKYPNVYTDTAALYFDSAREFMRQTLTVDVPGTWIDRSIRHQVMFGSNYPRFEQRRMAETLDTLGFREETVELIKGRNAVEFYRL